MTRPRLLPMVLLVALMQEGLGCNLAGAAPERERAELRETTPEPRGTSRLSDGVKRRLSKGFRKAMEWMVEKPSCRELFASREIDGIDALQHSIYVPARRGLESRVCESGAVAFTAVGNPVTRLCPGFARLVDGRAAITLIHEALHFAGLGEKPVDPDGWTSDQITRRVARACR